MKHYEAFGTDPPSPCRVSKSSTDWLYKPTPKSHVFGLAYWFPEKPKPAIVWTQIHNYYSPGVINAIYPKLKITLKDKPKTPMSAWLLLY